MKIFPILFRNLFILKEKIRKNVTECSIFKLFYFSHFGKALHPKNLQARVLLGLLLFQVSLLFPSLICFLQLVGALELNGLWFLRLCDPLWVFYSSGFLSHWLGALFNKAWQGFIKNALVGTYQLVERITDHQRVSGWSLGLIVMALQKSKSHFGS
jgi:hypothetical protein